MMITRFHRLCAPEFCVTSGARKLPKSPNQTSACSKVIPLNLDLSLIYTEPSIAVHGGPLGYPLLARFQNSEPNYMIYRRFGEIQARLLLEAQDDLRRLEMKLHHLDIDETDETRGMDPQALFTRKLYNKDSSAGRVALMQELKKAFKDHGKPRASRSI